MSIVFASLCWRLTFLAISVMRVDLVALVGRKDAAHTVGVLQVGMYLSTASAAIRKDFGGLGKYANVTM